MNKPHRLTVTGHYAGAISRAVAAILDAAAISTLFTSGVAGIDLLARVLGGITPDVSWATGVVAFMVWAFLYLFLSQAIVGRTLGKAVVGLRVVQADGSTLTGGRALTRTLTFPLSAALLGLGFLMIIVHPRHRALHDLFAGTAVVYDWGEREAHVPVPLTAFLQRRAAADVEPQIPPDQM